MRLITHDYFITVEIPSKGGMLSTVFRLGAVPIGKDTTALDRAVRALFGRRAKAVKIEPVTKAKPKRNWCKFDGKERDGQRLVRLEDGTTYLGTFYCGEFVRDGYRYNETPGMVSSIVSIKRA